MPEGIIFANRVQGSIPLIIPFIGNPLIGANLEEADYESEAPYRDLLAKHQTLGGQVIPADIL